MIRTKCFSHLDVDDASELVSVVGPFVKPSTLLLSFLYRFSMVLKKSFDKYLDYPYWPFHYTKAYIAPKWNTLTLSKNPQIGARKQM